MKKTPKHLGLIPDGNRRWAAKNNCSVAEGHHQGYKNFVDFFKWCKRADITTLTAYAFSTENWKRPEEEVEELMQLFEEIVDKFSEHKELENTKVRALGDKSKLPDNLRRSIENIEEKTEVHNEFNLNLALSYGGRWDIEQAVRKLAKEAVKKGEEFAKGITQEIIEDNLLLSDCPDLVIRTGGEKRLSNFLTWQTAYSELYFSDKLWPAFGQKDFEAAMEKYAKRQRRYGQ